MTVFSYLRVCIIKNKLFLRLSTSGWHNLKKIYLDKLMKNRFFNFILYSSKSILKINNLKILNKVY